MKKKKKNVSLDGLLFLTSIKIKQSNSEQKRRLYQENRNFVKGKEKVA